MRLVPHVTGLRSLIYERTSLAISSLVLAGYAGFHVHGQLVFTLGVGNCSLRLCSASLAMVTITTLDVCISAQNTKASK
jgi:hypothetical protein